MAKQPQRDMKLSEKEKEKQIGKLIKKSPQN